MRTFDPILFLLGHRSAINRVVSSAWALPIGFLLVLSAGLARNYDHLRLSQQWEWFLGPIAVSLISSVFIFIVITGPVGLHKHRNLAPQYGGFLAAFWMTAPCAWVYGIPVEAWTGLVTATRWNIAFLGFVAGWRVLLMARVLAVASGAGYFRCLLAILIPASVEMFFAVVFIRFTSVLVIMGGVRLPPDHAVIEAATSFVATGSVITFFAAIILLVVLHVAENQAGTATRPIPAPVNHRPHGLGALVFAVVALAGWFWIASLVQPRVRANHQLDRLIWDKRFAEAVAFASERTPDDFSAIHYLPPDPWTSVGGSQTVAVLIETTPDTPGWLVETWAEQLAIYLDSLVPGRVHRDIWGFDDLPPDWPDHPNIRPIVEPRRSLVDEILKWTIKPEREADDGTEPEPEAEPAPEQVDESP